MGKLLFYFLLFIVLAGVAFYFSSGIILHKASQFIIDEAISVCADNEVKIAAVAFQKVAFSSLNAVTWNGINFVGGVSKESAFGMDQEFSIHIDKVTITVENIFERMFSVKVSGASAISSKYKASSLDSSEDSDEFDENEFKVQLQLTSLKPRDIVYQFRGFSSVLGNFFKNGRTKFPVEFSGKVKLVNKKRVFKVRVMIQREGEEYVMVMDKQDLEDLCKVIQQPLNDHEITVFSRNPLRVPRLLKIRDYVYAASSKKHREKPSIQEDPYRHILWSFLLTRAFGEDFAKELSMAHEGAPDSATEKGTERMQDIVNDRVGRRYASSGYSESAIEDLMMADPEVALTLDTPESGLVVDDYVPDY